MRKIFLFALTLCMLFLFSCSKDKQDPKPIINADLEKLAEQTQQNRKIVVWGDGQTETGYEKLYLQFFDPSGKLLSNGEVSAMPIMYMNMNGESMSHSAPADPVKPGNDGLFEVGVVFTMASDGENGRWDISVIYVTPDNQVINFDVPIQVKQSTEKRVQNLKAAGGENYVLSFYQAKAPIIGVNETVFTLHKRESMMEFPAYQQATISIDPRMPDMGNHSSPNNVNPLHIGQGHYAGKLNYTMSGFWRVNVKINIAGEDLQTYFDQTF